MISKNGKLNECVMSSILHAKVLHYYKISKNVFLKERNIRNDTLMNGQTNKKRIKNKYVYMK